MPTKPSGVEYVTTDAPSEGAERVYEPPTPWLQGETGATHNGPGSQNDARNNQPGRPQLGRGALCFMQNRAGNEPGGNHL